MFMRRSLGTLLLLLSAALPAVAQMPRGTLSGTVLDARSGAPLADVAVTLVDHPLRARSDGQGRFRLTDVPAGTHLVEAGAAGFRTEQRAVAVAAGVVTTLDFALQTAALRAPQVDVIGPTAESLERIPGSATVINVAQLRAQVPLSGTEVFRTVPGVHVQEEEGLGMRANLGIRGLDPDRSRNVLMLEDGVPIALAPYGEPEMYYTPPIDRMARVEVVKGSGSIQWGPQTIGGVVNYVTPDPAATPTTMLDVRGGTGGMLHAEGRFGGTWGSAGTHFGVLRKQAEDLNGLFFRITDVIGKMALQLGPRSEVGVKLSIYDEQSNSTYIGLTESMFAADPYQHPSPDDRLWIRRYGVSATHDLFLGDNAVLRTTAYGHTISRDWMRRDYRYLAGGSTLELLGTTGNRNRSFDVAGIEPRLQWNHRLGGLRSDLDAGLRLHVEKHQDAHVNGATPTSRTGVIRDQETRTGQAFSAFVQNRFWFGDGFYVTPGVRVEAFEFERNILRTRVGGVPTDVDRVSTDRVSEVIPGIGASWTPSARLTLFGGVHRGFAPPRIKDAFVLLPGAQGVPDLVSLELDAERSWNAELGTRAAPAAGVQFEATAFVLDFSNQIIAPSLSAGAVSQAALANQGETRHVGIESGLQLDLGRIAALPFGLVADVRHTLVRSEFSADRFIRNAAGDTVNVRGNRLPYAPEQMVSGLLRAELPFGLSLRLDGSHVGEQFADNFETATPAANGRIGLIPELTLWNAAAAYQVPGTGVELFGTVKNLTDRTYIASRRPEGIKTGLPRTVQVGARVTFRRGRRSRVSGQVPPRGRAS
jgi:Fe(3+) dicitrate transport protein